MATRRAALALLAILVIAGAAVPAVAAPHVPRAPRAHGVPRISFSAEGRGSVIVLHFGTDSAAHLHFLHAGEPLEHVALADLDTDGYVDVLAAPRDGALIIWHNTGHGRFARVALPHGSQRIVVRGPRIAHVEKMDDGWQWGDDRHDAALPRAPDVIGGVPIAPVRVTTPLYIRPASFRRFSGRAPPVL